MFAGFPRSTLDIGGDILIICSGRITESTFFQPDVSRVVQITFLPHCGSKSIFNLELTYWFGILRPADSANGMKQASYGSYIVGCKIHISGNNEYARCFRQLGKIRSCGCLTWSGWISAFTTNPLTAPHHPVPELNHQFMPSCVLVDMLRALLVVQPRSHMLDRKSAHTASKSDLYY